MARDDDEFKRTIVHGESALQCIRQHRVAAHPRNYEFWYTYASGFHLRLNRIVDATIAQNGGVTEGDIAELYDRYLASSDFGEQVDELGILALGELDQVMATIDSASGSASAYGTRLHTLHSSIAGNSGRDSLRFVIEQLMTETREMEETNRSLRERLLASRMEILRLHERLETAKAAAFIDALSGLGNRKGFDVALHNAEAGALAAGSHFSVLMIDVDNFKSFNDRYGHLIGDQVLRLVAAAIKTRMSGEDIAARFGGDEFAMVLGGKRIDEAHALADEICRAISGKELVKRSTGESHSWVTVSIGVAAWLQGDNGQAVLERADTCLGSAKREGRNRVIAEAGAVPEARVA